MRRIQPATILILSILFAAHAGTAAAQGDPPTKVVQQVIRLHKDASTGQLRFVVDADTSRKGTLLTDKQIFVAAEPVFVTFRDFNPLKQGFSVKTTLVDSPGADALKKLVDALSAIPGIVTAAQAPSTPPAATLAVSTLCQEYDAGIATHMADLRGAIRTFGKEAPAVTSSKKFQDWTKEIDDAFANLTTPSLYGHQIITSIAAQIDEHVKAMSNQEKTTVDAADKVEAYDKSNATKCPERGRVVDGLVAQARVLVRAVGPLRESIEAFTKILKSRYTARDDWHCPVAGRCNEFIIATDVRVSAEQDAKVAVELFDIDVDWSSSTMRISNKPPVAMAFLVRQDMVWRPELGVGATFGFLTQEKFGTGKNAAGETVVARGKPTRVTFAPTVMVNFVHRNAPGIVPMLQIGASVTPTAPAVFLGGGWRGTGKNGFAIGAGLMMGWVKHLETLTEGVVIGGTKDIENDFKFDPKPRPSFYFNLQYKFGS